MHGSILEESDTLMSIGVRSLKTLTLSVESLRGFTIGNPLGCRGSACVEVMTTCMEAPRLFLRRAEGCVPLEGMIASARDLLKSTHIHLGHLHLVGLDIGLFASRSTDTFSLGSTSWIRVGGRLIRVSDQLDQRSDQRDMDSQIVTVDQFAEAMASIQEAIVSLGRRIDGQAGPTVRSGLPASHHRAHPTSEDPHARMDRLEQGLRQLRALDRATTWEGFDGVPVASLPAKFRMPDIESGAASAGLHLWRPRGAAHGTTWPRSSYDSFRLNTVVDVSRRELEALRQRTEESVSSFISRWRGKIAEIIDRPSERDQIQMVLRSLQPRMARHVVGAPFTDFGSLVMALYDVEDGISRGLWTDSSSSDVKGKKPFVGQRSTDYRPRHLDQLMIRHILRRLWLWPYYAPRALRDPRFPTRLQDSHASCSVHCETRRALSPTQSSVDFCSLCFEDAEAVLTDRHAVEPGSSEAYRGWVIDYSHPSPAPQPIPPQFRMDLHCAYHQGPGHETDRCTALRHAVQDLIDQGLVHLGQPSVTTNRLPAHTTHVVPPPADDIHFLEFDEIDDHIHMLSDDDSDPEPIMPDWVQAPYVDDSQTLDIQYVLRGGRVMRQPPPAAAARPLGGTSSQEEVRAEDDEILRQLQSTQARISIWSLLASSSTHRDALTRALSQIRVDTTTTPEGLIHMMTAGRATCIVFSDDDLPPEGSGHTRPLYISVGCSGRRVPSVLLDNGSALNVCPLATAIALGYAPSDFGPSTQTVRAYDSTRREVMGTLEIELLIGPTTFITIFQVLRIPTSFNLLLGRPWIHRAGAIPSSLHQKVKFIHEGQTLELGDFCRDFIAMSFDQHGSTVVLDIMRGMSYLPGMGLGRRQHGPTSSSPFLIMTYHLGLGSSHRG
ncbi:hypothetical protein CK203_087291 [Vitis vinifera]|uniref:Retrotransposon gag domain-containing protein n=1 Tax=Vitis vinifera TaxID=29760 RepID=A0A438BM73_VITVI|nr:hypothetical protein CK203_087291 [Vitis vinifera]